MGSYKLFTFYFLLLTFALFAGCATTEDVGRVQWEVSDLRSEIAKAKETNNKVQSFEDAQKAMGRGQSELLSRVESLTREVQVISGKLEERQHLSEKAVKESISGKDVIIAQLKDLETKVKELKERLTVLEAAEKERKEVAAKKTQEAKEQKTAKKEPKDLYLEAYDTYKKGKTKEARERFESLIKEHPKNEYSSKAQFWIGESYYKDKNYESAILAYEDYLRENPKDEKTPEALLRQGYSFYAIGDAKTGKVILEKLIEKFPNSSEAKMAKKKLGETTKKKR
ncbi:MAG: tol-pal system protein YbgF [Nitrospirae bacterium]|nr:tol-pal system protein YbgF [Nitrospirota bacterium]